MNRCDAILKMQKQVLLFFSLLLFFPACAQSNNDSLFKNYFQAKGAYQKSKAAKKIISADVPFQHVFDELHKGQAYRPDVKTGFIKIKQEGKGLPPGALVFIPYNYTPEKKYQLMVNLHGAVSNLDPDFIYRHFVDTLAAAYKEIQTIYVYPSAWLWTPWWSNVQYENINQLISEVKKKYNVDEDQVRLGGVSDGGTGSYYLANCNITPWSCVTSFIGAVGLLDYLKVRPTFMRNFSHTPFYVVNTGKDHLFPKDEQLAYFDLLGKVNAASTRIMVDSSGHSMNWFPSLRDSIQRFVKQHARNPFPTQLSWSTNSDQVNNRCFYFIIRQLGNQPPSQMTDLNNEIELNGKKRRAHLRDSIYGRAEVEVNHNTIKVRSENIKKYTFLISPSQFDMNVPVTIWINDRKHFEQIVKPDVRTLLKWNSIDQDRTMLYAAELSIQVK